MLAKVVSQCPFTNAICILDERGMDIVSNTRMMLVSHPPNIITIIPFKGK